MSKKDKFNPRYKLKVLPHSWHPEFMGGMDKRCGLYKAMARDREEILVDKGGIDNLSIFELTLVDRLLFARFAINNIELIMLKGPKHLIHYQEKWCRLVDMEARLMSKLGIKKERRKLPALTVHAIQAEFDAKKKKKRQRA